MNDDTHLPEDDENRRLARRLADSRDPQVASEDAAFVDALRALKGDGERPSADASMRMWAHVEAAGRDDSDALRARRPDHGPRRLEDRHTIPGLRALPKKWIWTAAAAIMVGAIVALLTLQGSEPELVASAGAVLEEYAAVDGSIVTLRPNSELYLVEASDSGLRFRLDGEAFFDVTPNVKRSFAVEAGTAVVQVVGTRFDVSTWTGSTSVYLQEGRVRFSHIPTGETVVLDPGEWSGVTAGGGVLDPVSEEPDEHLDWMTGTLTYQERPIGMVAAELSQHYSVVLELPDAVQGETLSGRILLEDVNGSLDQFGRALGGRFVQSEAGSYRFEPE